MAVVPARAWSAAGVTSLGALQAPFLFESDEHVAAVVDDAAITTDLLSGLDGIGVTGLTLFPESLRHLFSFGEPILSPADVKGRTIRAIASLETTAIIEALGGTAVDPDAMPTSRASPRDHPGHGQRLPPLRGLAPMARRPRLAMSPSTPRS